MLGSDISPNFESASVTAGLSEGNQVIEAPGAA
jgi:hypothetical protein